MKLLQFKLLALTLIFVLSSGSLESQDRPGKPNLHSPAEIMKIMEASPIIYEIGDDYVPDTSAAAPTVLTNSFYIKEEGSGKISAISYHLTPDAKQVLDSGEVLFAADKIKEALGADMRLKELQPDFYHVWALVGDAHFVLGQFDDAKRSFQEAIRLNYVDFYAHWFLGDTYDKLGMPDSAIAELTIAHVLNVNHAKLLRILKRYRTDHGKEWDDWTFEPKYSLAKEGNKVRILTTEDWLGYAMVKAVWRYEPGYASKMLGERNSQLLTSTTEEKEAIMAYLATHESDKRLWKIIDDGFIDEFIFYEIIGKAYPLSIVLRQRSDFLRIVEYVNNCH